ncbi:probable carbohydrate esterase At4g34215 [Diospyros lotus]|uniref:probable carbohydrate esterase At4g34215 n=1 Tax=Diospyros lotus TaxID=55363 RepID=UPI0022555FF9|nr:probable carbohydrate esterase At4g34215 [Diospyros lotus]
MALTFLWLMLLAHAGLVSPQASPQQPPKTIFILAGQSNMSGRGGVINTTWDGLVPPECRPRASILRLSAELRWEEAAEPLHRDIDVYAVCGVGPGMAFANSVLQRHAGFGVVGLVPCAVGGTKISQWARGSNLYNQLVRRAAAAAQGGGAIQALLWYQGESDTVNEEDARLYKSRLQQFFMDLRADLQSPLLPIIQVALASGQGRYVEEVREGQMGIDLANVRYVDGKGLELEADHVHLSTAAQVRLGQMLAHAFLQTQPNLVHLHSSHAHHASKPLHTFLLHLLKPFLIISFSTNKIIAYIVYEF